MRLHGIIQILCTTIMVSACGGGGGDDQTSSINAQGLWVGRTSTNRIMTAIALSDGSLYAIYSPAGGSASTISGVVQGTWRASENTFSSTDARDFSLEEGDIFPATITASYTKKTRLDGSIRYADGTTGSFATTYDADYDTKPTIAALEGYFDGKVATAEGSSGAYLQITTSGAISGYSYTGCRSTGTITPRTDANVYQVTLQLGAAPCTHPNLTYQGIAYFRRSTGSLLMVLPNAARTDGVLYAGVKL